MNNISGKIVKAIVAALETVSELFVMDAKLVQDGGVEIVNGHRLVEVLKIQISKAGCGQQHGCDYCNEL